MKNDLVLRVVAKLLIPFILLFALYVQFHGDFGPGGGFQAGVIIAAAVIFYALIYGLPAARKAVPEPLVESMMAVGVLIYAGVGVAGLLLGGNFLDYFVLDPDPVHGQDRGIFWVEVGVADHRLRRDAEDLLHVRRPRQGRPAHERIAGSRRPARPLQLLRHHLPADVAGLFIVIARGNLIKKLVGLGIFQTSVYLLYIAPGKLHRRHGADHQRRLHGLFQPAAACADPDRHRRRRGHAGAGPGAGGAHPRGLRHDRGGRDPAAGRRAPAPNDDR